MGAPGIGEVVAVAVAGMILLRRTTRDPRNPGTLQVASSKEPGRDSGPGPQLGQLRVRPDRILWETGTGSVRGLRPATATLRPTRGRAGAGAKVVRLVRGIRVLGLGRLDGGSGLDLDYGIEWIFFFNITDFSLASTLWCGS